MGANRISAWEVKGYGWVPRIHYSTGGAPAVLLSLRFETRREAIAAARQRVTRAALSVAARALAGVYDSDAAGDAPAWMDT